MLIIVINIEEITNLKTKKLKSGIIRKFLINALKVSLKTIKIKATRQMDYLQIIKKIIEQDSVIQKNLILNYFNHPIIRGQNKAKARVIDNYLEVE